MRVRRVKRAAMSAHRPLAIDAAFDLIGGQTTSALPDLYVCGQPRRQERVFHGPGPFTQIAIFVRRERGTSEGTSTGSGGERPAAMGRVV